jgi:hypothetical protein
MDLLRAYGGSEAPKRVVAVAAEVELGGATPHDGTAGRFAKQRPQGRLGLPQPRRDEEEEGGEEEKQEKAKKRKVLDAAEQEDEEEDEDDEEQDAVGRLPSLPRAAAAPVAAAVGPARPVQRESSAGGAAPGPARPGVWGYARYPELGATALPVAPEEEEEEEEGRKKGPVMREVRQTELLSDQARIQAELAHEIAAPPASLTTSFGGRRKHQLGQMAQETAANMSLYEADKARAQSTRKQVKAKYGW